MCIRDRATFPLHGQRPITNGKSSRPSWCFILLVYMQRAELTMLLRTKCISAQIIIWRSARDDGWSSRAILPLHSQRPITNGTQALWQYYYVQGVYLRRSTYMKIHKTDEAHELFSRCTSMGRLQTEKSTKLIKSKCTSAQTNIWKSASLTKLTSSQLRSHHHRDLFTLIFVLSFQIHELKNLPQ